MTIVHAPFGMQVFDSAVSKVNHIAGVELDIRAITRMKFNFTPRR